VKLANSRWRAGTRRALIAAACVASAALATCAQAPTIGSLSDDGPSHVVALDEGNVSPEAFRLRLPSGGKRPVPAVSSASYAGDVLFTSAAACEVEPDVAESSLETELVALARDVLAPDASVPTLDYQPDHLSHSGLDYDAGSGAQGNDSHAYAAVDHSAAPGGYAPDGSGHSPDTDAALNPQLGSSVGITPHDEPGAIAQHDPLLPLGPEDGGEILPDLFLPEIDSNSLNLAAGESGDSPSALAAVPEPASLLTWSLLLGCGLYSARRRRKSSSRSAKA